MQKEINKFENERNEIERCLYFLNGNDNLSNEEVAFLEMHITQKKRELVNKTFKRNIHVEKYATKPSAAT